MSNEQMSDEHEQMSDERMSKFPTPKKCTYLKKENSSPQLYICLSKVWQHFKLLENLSDDAIA